MEALFLLKPCIWFHTHRMPISTIRACLLSEALLGITEFLKTHIREHVRS